MSRLIDADAMIKALREADKKCPNDIIKACIGLVQTQFTAYDVEKVVEELKEISVIYCEEYKQREGSLYLQDAVEIVKRGGINE